MPASLIDQTVIPRVHPDVFTAIGRSHPVEPTGALGILESFNVATMIEAAAAVKAADVTLMEIRLAMALGGKAFASFSGLEKPLSFPTLPPCTPSFPAPVSAPACDR